MKKYIIGLMIIGLNLTACTTVRKSTSTTANIDADIFQYPAVADIEVGKKIEKTETWEYNPFMVFPTLSERKSNMIADMVKSENSDILLETQSTYTRVPFGQRTLTISGYPAKYKDFRPATEEDIKAFKKLNGIESHDCLLQEEAAAQTTIDSKKEKESSIEKRNKEKFHKTGREFVIRGAYAINGGLDGCGLVNEYGYSAGIEINSYIKKNFYWNTGLDFSSKSFIKDKYDSYNSDTEGTYKMHALQIPLGIGYRMNFNRTIGVSLNTSMLFSFDMSGQFENSRNESYKIKEIDNDYSVFDFGFNIRMDIWISKVKFEVSYKPYIAKINGIRCQSLSFGLGYAF